jgi:hypothetical protein
MVTTAQAAETTTPDQPSEELLVCELKLQNARVANQDLTARVTACEEALDLADKAINSQADTIRELDVQNVRLQKSLDYAIAEAARSEARADAWYRNPNFVAPMGLIFGFLAGAYVTKRVQ